MIDIRQTSKYTKYLRQINWIVEDVNHTSCFIKKLPLIGSVIKIQRPEAILLKKIEKLAKKHHAFQIIIEPKTELDAKFLKNVGFRLSRSPYLPTKTLHLDLTATKEELFKQLKKDAKQAIKKAESSNIKCQNIEKFRKAWKKAVSRKRYVPPLRNLKALKESLGNDCLFLLTEDNSAGVIFLRTDKIAYYWQAFTNQTGRKSLTQYKIVWEGILWAKEQGVKIFDFGGIYDNRFPNKSWFGFSHFKKSFGGHEMKYPGAFVKIYLTNMVKKVSKTAFVIVILLLDYAALDDITTGNEPDYYGEYAILVISVIIFGFLIFKFLKKRNAPRRSN